jgi:ABC-type multidrug transport system fused ATPase/permease subunit
LRACRAPVAFQSRSHRAPIVARTIRDRIAQSRLAGTAAQVDAILKGQVDLMVLLVVAALFSGAAGMLHEYLQARLCASVPGEVRARVFEHTQRLPLSRLRTSIHGDLITRITSDACSVEPALWSIGYIAAARVRSGQARPGCGGSAKCWR